MMDTYPMASGWKRNGTSKNAAPGKIKNLTDKELILGALKLCGPMTADELATALDLSPFSARPRVSELRALHLIEATGETRPNASGKQADVMRLK